MWVWLWHLQQRARTWLRRNEGQAMSEYGVIIAIVLVGIIGTLIAFRGQLDDVFDLIMEKIEADTGVNPPSSNSP